MLETSELSYFKVTHGHCRPCLRSKRLLWSPSRFEEDNWSALQSWRGCQNICTFASHSAWQSALLLVPTDLVSQVC